MIALSLSISLIIAYLIGSIPFAYLYGKAFKKIDIRQHGSGNVGATNVMRVLGTKAGLIVFFLDVLKGFLPVFLAQMIFSDTIEYLPVLVAIFTILGHTFTIFLSFKGGKGVASAAGVFIAFSPYTFIAAITLFAIIVYFTRYVSLGSIIALIAITIANFLLPELSIYVKYFTLIVSVFIIYLHKSNIKRLMNGTENKFGIKN